MCDQYVEREDGDEETSARRRRISVLTHFKATSSSGPELWLQTTRSDCLFPYLKNEKMRMSKQEND